MKRFAGLIILLLLSFPVFAQGGMGPGPGIGPFTPPGPPGFARTAKGTAFSKTGTATLSSVSIATGASIIVVVQGLSGSASSCTLTWNGTSLNRDTAATQNSAVWSLHNVTGATGNVVATDAGGNQISFAVIQVTGLTASPFDKFAGGSSGSGTTPTSGATATTTQASELLVGAIATIGPVGDAAGTWSNGFNAGQRDGSTGGSAASNGTISEGYLVVSSTGAYTAAKTGITSRSNSGAIATYKIAP
jgi:hypothetical protein